MDKITGDEVSPEFSPLTPASLLSSLDKFISMVSKINGRRTFPYNRSSVERNGNIDDTEQSAIQTALCLLQNLPPARPAALSFLAQALSKQVWQHMQRKEVSSQNSKEDNLVNQIVSLLSSLIESSPDIWASLVARWTVDQLGRWSVEWDGVILGRGDTTLEERVAKWLACQPANALANLTVSCVALDADNTVAALLDASFHSGPALDWLVAHVGCSFPATIVNRVLALGLRSFANSTTQNQATQQLSSVNIILNHLADGHFLEIQRGMQAILMTTFSGSSDNYTKAAVPYLLQLASTNRSRSVLSALATSLPDAFQTSQQIKTLATQLNWWVPHFFPTTVHLIDLLVHLLLDCDGPAACTLIGLLLQGSIPSNSAQSITFPSQLLHSLLFELCAIVYIRPVTAMKAHIPFLSSLGMHTQEENIMKSDCASGMSLSDIIEWAIKVESEITIKRLAQLLTYVIVHEGPEAACGILHHILTLDCSASLSSLFLLNCVMNATVCQQAFHQKPLKALSSVLTQTFESNAKPSQIFLVLEKVSALAKGTRNSKTYISVMLSQAILTNISRLTKLINTPHLGISSLELIGQFTLNEPLCLSHIFGLGHASVFFFCNSLKETDIKFKLKKAHLCSKIISQLSHSSLGHNLVMRILFESAFRPEWSYLFGADHETTLEFKESPDHLLRTNLQFDSWVKLPQSHNTIFHAGKVGRELINRKRRKYSKIDSDSVSLNCQLLLNLVGMCCRAQGHGQGMTTIALLMVEYISPDIMCNGFPWHEENIKFTFERDLTIKKTFEEFPVSWHFLELVSRSRPALCYCSVLVRALTAALTAFWNTYPGNSSLDHPSSLEATERLLEIMIVGQLVPKAFSILPQMFKFLAPHEVVYILQDVWSYLRDHTPSPDRWELMTSGLHERQPDTIDPRYTDRIRKLIQVHIKDLGHLLPIMLKHS